MRGCNSADAKRRPEAVCVCMTWRSLVLARTPSDLYSGHSDDDCPHQYPSLPKQADRTLRLASASATALRCGDCVVGGPDVCRGMAKAGTATARRSERSAAMCMGASEKWSTSLPEGGCEPVEQERGGFNLPPGGKARRTKYSNFM